MWDFSTDSFSLNGLSFCFSKFSYSIHSKYGSRLFEKLSNVCKFFAFIPPMSCLLWQAAPSDGVPLLASMQSPGPGWRGSLWASVWNQTPANIGAIWREIFFFPVGFGLIALAGEGDRWHLLSGVGRQVGTKHDTLTTQHYTCHEINSQPHTILTQNLQHFHLKIFLENYHLWI